MHRAIKTKCRLSGHGVSCVPMRYVLLLLGFLGCALHFLLRSSLSVAIVAMVNSTNITNTTTSNSVCPTAFNATIQAQESKGGGEYNWTLQDQGIILGTLSWGYLTTKCIGGRIAEVLGGRATIGLTLMLCGILSILCPLAAEWHPMALAALRLLMGLLQGPIYPAVYSIITRWAPTQERSTMLLVVSAGFGVGCMMGLGLSGVVIDRMGWRWLFYGGGIISLLWTPFWFFLGWNCPAEHPFISAKESQLLSQIHVRPKRRVPWSRLLRCRTIYILILAEFVSSWQMTFSANQAPIFLTEQIGMFSATSATLLTLTTATGSLGLIINGMLSDFLFRKEFLSLLGMRKLLYSTGLTVVVACCVGIICAGCNQTWVFVLFLVLHLGSICQRSAYSMTPIDIASNYSATIVGIIGVGQLGAFIAPIVNAWLIPLNHGWDIAIMVTCLLTLVAGGPYVFCVTAEEQEWNLYEEVGDF